MHPARAALPFCLLFAGVTVAQDPIAFSDETGEAVPLAGGTTIAARFGYVRVPENRSGKDSKTIDIAVLRVPSPLAKPGLPVFFLAGGPGGSSIDAIKFFLRGGGRPLLELFGGDVVAIDQRGVGKSRPNLETSVRYGFPVEAPGDRATMLAAVVACCRAEAARWREKGVDLAGYTTAESADDVDAVRRALGYDKIALMGPSYGTHLAMATLRRHGAHVARAVLIGPEGPDHTLKLPRAAQAGLARLAKLAAADPEWGEKLPDLADAVRKVLSRLAVEPAYADVDGTRIGVSAFDVQRTLANEIGLVRGHADRVPALVHAMLAGDFTQIARELAEDRRTAGPFSVMAMVMDCASGASAARRELIAKEAKTHLLADAVNFPFGEPGLREAFRAPDLGEAFRAPLRTEVPVLFLAGELDSRTPVGNAKELMRGMPNAKLIVVENAAHDMNWMQKELREAWSGFLKGEKVAVARVTARPVRFVGR